MADPARKLEVNELTRSKSALTRETVAFLKSELETLNRDYQKKVVKFQELKTEQKERNRVKRHLSQAIQDLESQIKFINRHISRV
jgi:hypothetical protein